MIIRSFKRGGITTNVDGSENGQVKLQGLEDYVMPVPEEDFYIEKSSSEESKEEEWVTDNDDNGNKSCTTDCEESSFSDNGNED